MDDFALEAFQRDQSRTIARDIIQQSEAQSQRVQANWQHLWENAHQHLISFLRNLDPDYDESCKKSNRPLEKFSDDDLAYLIHVRLRSLAGDPSKKQTQNTLAETQQKLADLSHKYVELEHALSTVQEACNKLQEEKSALEAHLSALRQVQKNAALQNAQPSEGFDVQAAERAESPAWFKTWQKTRLFDKTSTAIHIMGETGSALRPTIIKRMATHLSLSPGNKNLDEALNWLLTLEDQAYPVLIEQVKGILEQGSSSGGNHPAVLRLTEEGCIAYRILTGKVPKENEYDSLIKVHSSPEHTILNIQVREILQEEGYFIRGQAQTIQLSNGETYIPDLTVIDQQTGEITFIEVERDVNKDHLTRKQKWLKFYEASNGNLYVFCDNLNCQRAIQGEINLALTNLAYNSNLTNLHGIRSGKRSERDGSIWLSQRKGKQQNDVAHRSSHVVPPES